MSETGQDVDAAAVGTGQTDEPSGSILIVDDEPGVVSALRRLLRRTRYEVHTAESGAAGLEILDAHPVDLVISDMRMPHMSGAEFLARVQAGWPETVRLLLTGYADIDSVVSAINDGGCITTCTSHGTTRTCC